MQDLTKIAEHTWNRVVLDELLALEMNVLTAYPLKSLDEEAPVRYVGLTERRPIVSVGPTPNRIFAFLRGYQAWRVLAHGLSPKEGPDSNEYPGAGFFIRRFKLGESPLQKRYPNLTQWTIRSTKGLDDFLKQIRQKYSAEEMSETVSGYCRLGLLHDRVAAILT